jgi:alkaline phosphatase
MNIKMRIATIVCCLAISVAAVAKTPKYIFYFIGDGMGMSHVMTTEAYNRLVLGNHQHILMMQFPVATMATSYSFNSPITDSAAAGTALATGHKTNNDMIAMSPDTVAVSSIAQELKSLGYGIVIATSVPLDDATPAVFYANQPSRRMFYEIDKQLPLSGYDMFVGGSLRGTKSKNGPTDAIERIQKAGYTIAYGADQYEKIKGKNKLVLLNNDSTSEQFGYTIDSIRQNLHLPYITKACIEHEMKFSPNKFFMMIEGGNIDWAAHANDAAAVVKEVLNFNEAIREAYNFYLKHPDETLILITADHCTGGLQMGNDYHQMYANLKNFDYERISLQAFGRLCEKWIKNGTMKDWEKMKIYLQDNLGLYGPVKVSDAQDKEIQEEFRKAFVLGNNVDKKTLYATYSNFVAKVYNVFDDCNGIGWTTHSHAGDFTPVFAIGAGSEIFQGVNNNTDLPNKIRKLTGLKVQ